MTAEHKLQNTIRNALVDECLLFRANVGKGWTSSQQPIKAARQMQVTLQPGDVVLRQARPFDTGLPPGFSDTFGLVAVTITQDMVGKTFGRFIAGEIKTETGRVSDKQAAFLRAVNDNGGAAGVWRSPADALAMVASAKGAK